MNEEQMDSYLADVKNEVSKIKSDLLKIWNKSDDGFRARYKGTIKVIEFSMKHTKLVLEENVSESFAEELFKITYDLWDFINRYFGGNIDSKSS